MRFADDITLSKDEALEVLQILHLAAGTLADAGLLAEGVQAQEMIELIEDRLTPEG